MNQPADPTASDGGDPQPAVVEALDRTLESLYGRINYERQIRVSPDGFRLQTMRELMRRLGDPQLTCPAIHVAGTKGKGSVSTMVGSILSESGLRTGVYTSPHLETIHQRMAIDGQLITDAQLLGVLNEIMLIVAAMDAEADPATDPTLTFFEITTAAALLFFAQQKVDYVVLEVGLGGRMDSTNICQPVVCVITNISFDHTRQLGKTIDKIAREKAGIIKPGVPVVSGAIKPEAATSIEGVARKQAAPLFQLDREFRMEELPVDAAKGFSIPFSVRGDLTRAGGGDSAPKPLPLNLTDLQLVLPGAHQRTNAALAVAAVSLLSDVRDQITPATIASGLNAATLNGRTEIVSRSPLVILDIAHNPAAIDALVVTLQNEVPHWNAARRRTILFATSSDKDATGMLGGFVGSCDRLVLTEYQTNPRALRLPKLVAKASETEFDGAIDPAPAPASAWEAVLESLEPDDAVCITGSAFLVAELRPVLQAWQRNRR